MKIGKSREKFSIWAKRKKKAFAFLPTFVEDGDKNSLIWLEKYEKTQSFIGYYPFGIPMWDIQHRKRLR